MKRINIDLLRTGRFSSILHGSRVIFNNGSPRSIKTWVWNWLVRLETSRWLPNLSFWSLKHVLNPILFSSRVSKRSLVEAQVTCHTSLVYAFSSFHPNNFRNTTRWKCFLKDDCIRSSLIKLQYFPHSKIDVDPIYCVLMSLPCFMHVLCMTRSTQVDRIRILVIACPWDPQAENHCLSVAQILTSRVSIPN